MSIKLNVLSLERSSDGSVFARVELPKGHEYDIFRQAETLNISISFDDPKATYREPHDFYGGQKVWITPILDPDSGERIGSYIQPREGYKNPAWPPPIAPEKPGDFK